MKKEILGSLCTRLTMDKIDLFHRMEAMKRSFLEKRNCLIIKSNQKLVFSVEGLQDEIKNHSQDPRTDRGDSTDETQRNVQLSNLFIKRLEFHAPCALTI
jgi:hypothetical protein